MKRVAVIGAGITGLSTAYYLSKEGYQVTVYEAERYPAMKTSFANGGQISVSNSEVWTSWSNVIKGIKWMFTKNAPLLIRPRLDWAQWKWMAKFLYYTAKGVYKENTVKTVQMGLESRKWDWRVANYMIKSAKTKTSSSIVATAASYTFTKMNSTGTTHKQ